MERILRLQISPSFAKLFALVGICTLLFMFRAQYNDSASWQGSGADVTASESPAGVKIDRHPWLRQGIWNYQLMDFDYTRECYDIDWDVYAAEFKQRVEMGYRVCGGSAVRPLGCTPC
jgi:hypothetical protein